MAFEHYDAGRTKLFEQAHYPRSAPACGSSTTLPYRQRILTVEGGRWTNRNER